MNWRHTGNLSRKTAGPLAVAALMGLAPAALAADKLTYEDNILPILRNSCLKCHNPDKLKGDLDLSTFPGVLKGGGSGPAAVSGDPDGSKIVKAVTHAEEPNMPPNSPKLPDKEIDTIRKWIAGGLLETSGSKAIAASRPKVDLTLGSAAVGKPEGPPPMPGDLLLETLVQSSRPSAATALAGSPWAPIVAIGGQKQVLIYNSDTLALLGILPFPEGFPFDVKFSRNGKLVVSGGGHASKSGQVAVWDIASGDRIITVGDEFDSVLASDISGDQKLIALGGPSRVVKIYSTKDGELLHKMKKHTDWVTALEFSPNGKYLATGDRNGGLVVWEAASGQEFYTLNGHKGTITGISWRDDSEFVLSSSEDGTIKMWKMGDGQQARSWTAHNGGVLNLRVAHDGRVISSGRDNQLAVWDATGNRQKSAQYTNDLPVRVAFSHDGARFVSSDWAGKVVIWNTTNAVALGELQVNPPALADRISQASARISELDKLVEQAPARVAEAESQIARLKDEAGKAGKDTPAARDLNKRLETATKDLTDLKEAVSAAPGQISITKATLARLQAGQQYSMVFKAKVDLSSMKAEFDKLNADLEAAKSAVAKASTDVAAARKTKPKDAAGKAELEQKVKALTEQGKTASARVSTLKAAVDRMSREFAAEKSRVEKMVSDYERNKGNASTPSPAAPVKAAKL